ncbi:MAG: diguanylate cyclase [Proteobacteria bacterium]|nr:diguanylate cyclase [Pseudomonadota bacterium]
MSAMGLLPEPGIKLLLVEDEPTQRLLIARKLRGVGYTVDMAENGTDALRMIKTGQYPLVLSDWEMPGMDGVTLCRLVREANLPSVYILLLTSHGAVTHAVEALRAGANDFIRKPADETELVARLEAGRRMVLLEQSLREANAQIEKLSITDPLLGIFNRRYLHEHLPQETSRARRYAEQFSLVMADLDHFKKVNDTYGHHTGDLVLQHAVNLARSALRVSDWIARYGGEEFVIVLPETPILGAYAVAERMRRLCAETPVKGLDSKLLVTASFGVATIDGVAASPEDADALLREADKALYESKRAGRNRVTCGPKCVPQRESRSLVAANNSERVSANASQTDR